MAVFLLSLSFWLQIWKIHIHKEVRDLSLSYNILLASSSVLLAFTAYKEGSVLFFVKQILTAVPVSIIIFQIIYHKGDRWDNLGESKCSNCREGVETYWRYCPYCGKGKG